MFFAMVIHCPLEFESRYSIVILKGFVPPLVCQESSWVVSAGQLSSCFGDWIITDNWFVAGVGVGVGVGVVVGVGVGETVGVSGGVGVGVGVNVGFPTVMGAE
jgi:hypothetical protein